MQIYFDSPAGRQLMEMSEEDYAKLPHGTRAQAEVVDQKTGRRFVLRRVSCGVNKCLCALTLVKEVELASAPSALRLGQNALRAMLIDAIATNYCTTPAKVETDLQDSEADFDLANLCETLASCGY